MRHGCPCCFQSVELPVDWDFTVIDCPHCGLSTNLMAASEAEELRKGDRLGHFVLVALLGSGGNGTVWKAHDQKLDRDVAIKFPSHEIREQKDRVRFLREASLAARVTHPHIVPIYHVGESQLERPLPDGICKTLPSRVHIISKLVNGAGLDRLIKAGNRLDPFQAVRIVERIADALGAAHQATVIHRDVKPSNIMLDREGRPYLLDFGVSKSSDTEHRTISLEGAIIGSPGYLSPEQARGENSSLDVRSDVYSLGVVLFELLTLRLPFAGTEKEIEHAAADPARDAPSPRQFVPAVPRDLETICLKCLEKDRELRFANGRELAEELQRFNSSLPILSRPITRVERFVRWCRRKPLIAGLSAAVLLTVIVGVSVAMSLDRSRTELKTEFASVDRDRKATQKALETTTGDLTEQRIITEKKTAEAKSAEELAAQNEYFGNIRLASQSIAQNNMETAATALEACPEKLRDWEWGYLHAEVDQGLYRCPTSNGLFPIAPSPDGTRFAVCDPDGTIRIIAFDGFRELTTFTANKSIPNAIAWSNDSKLLATGSFENGEVTVCDVETRQQVFQHATKLIRQIQFGATPSRLFASSTDGAVLHFDITAETPVVSTMVTVNPADRFAVNKDGSRLAALDIDGRRLSCFDTATGELIWVRNPEGREKFKDVDLSLDGKRVLAATDGAGAWLVDAADGRTVTTLAREDSRTRFARFSPDGNLIGVGLLDGSVETFHFFPLVGQSRFYKSLKANTAEVTSMTIFTGGLLLFTGTPQGTIDVAALPYDGHWQFRGHRGTIRGVLSIPNVPVASTGRPAFLSWSDDGTARIWALSQYATPQKVARGDQLDNLRFGVYPTKIDVSPDGTTGIIRSAQLQNSARLVLMPREQQIALLEHDAWIGCVEFETTGSRVLTGSLDHTLRLWNAKDGTRLATFAGHTAAVTAAVFSPGGQEILSGSSDNSIRVWEASSGESLRVLEGHAAEVTVLQFAPDGQQFASGDKNGVVKFWDVATWTSSAATPAHQGAVIRIQYSPDGGQALSASDDGVIRIWDTRNGEILQELSAGGKLADVTIHRSWKRIVTLNLTGMISVWDIDTRQRILDIPSDHQWIPAEFKD